MGIDTGTAAIDRPMLNSSAQSLNLNARLCCDGKRQGISANGEGGYKGRRRTARAKIVRDIVKLAGEGWTREKIAGELWGEQASVYRKPQGAPQSFTCHLTKTQRAAVASTPDRLYRVSGRPWRMGHGTFPLRWGSWRTLASVYGPPVSRLPTGWCKGNDDGAAPFLRGTLIIALPWSILWSFLGFAAYLIFLIFSVIRTNLGISRLTYGNTPAWQSRTPLEFMQGRIARRPRSVAGAGRGTLAGSRSISKGPGKR